MYNINFLLLDTETTGLDPENNEIIEIGYSIYNSSFGFLESDSSLCSTDMKIPPEASAIHHITNSTLKNAPKIETILSKINLVCKENDVKAMVCHNLSFDASFMSKYVNNKDYPFLNMLEGICTLRLARRMFTSVESHSLQVLRYSLNLESYELEELVPHRALADVLILSLLFERILKVKKFSTFTGFIRYADEPFLLKSLPFGKYKGTPFNKIERNYLEWLLKRPQLDNDIRYTVEVELGLKKHLT